MIITDFVSRLFIRRIKKKFDDDGKRHVLGISIATSEAEIHWRNFLQGLVQRVLHGVETITSDAHAGLQSAIRTLFTGVQWQRCQFHLQQNAMS